MGKINRIQLRGISRTPSDRMTSDGGCAESLNAYLQDSEIAPAITPDDATDIVGSKGKRYKAKKVFVHKSSNYTNYLVYLQDKKIVYYGFSDTGAYRPYVSFDEDETLMDITSVGNTVIIATSKRMYYLLYTYKEYKNLGSKIPEPMIEFQCTHTNDSTEVTNIPLLQDGTYESSHLFDRLDLGAWERAIKSLETGSANDDVPKLQQIQNEIWAAVTERAKKAKSNKRFLFPFLIRYAVRLYDGSYIHQSVPILLGAGYDTYLEVTGQRSITKDEIINSTIKLSLTQTYFARAFIKSWDTDGWSDIIESVDLFISTDICHPMLNSNVSQLKLTSSNTAGSTDFSYYSIHFKNGDASDLAGMESEILSKSNFYKIASFGIGDSASLTKGYNIADADIELSEDKLVTKERLPDYEQSGVEIIPSSLHTYNGRLLAVGHSKVIPTGYNFLQSTSIIPKQYPDEQSYAIAYFLKGNDGVERKILSRAKDGEYLLSTYSARVVGDQGTSILYSIPYGLLFFPDSRCTKVKIWEKEEVYDIEMKPHPLLNCSYAFWGLSKTYKDASQPAEDVPLTTFVSGENRLETDTNKLYTSQPSNPFYFPVSGNITTPADIVGIAISSASLSQGQFGQFPLYAFTTEGIWVIETATDGRFLSLKPLSREVCINPASITSLDQSAVFISAKGVMLLEGSQITELSSSMNGRHYQIEDVARTIIEGTTYSSLLPAATDPDPFLYFMKDAKIAYDYSGKRLIFISESNQGYQYVYKLDTHTWHKLSLGLNLQDPINSYPDCLVIGTDGTYTKIYNLSTLLDEADSDKDAAKILIATRPFDLDEPDVYKTITAVRIRGQYAAGSVKFILQGSHDGINFYTINTLRGKSWKLFRLIILANLSPTERISWIDVEYETRFTNKLR